MKMLFLVVGCMLSVFCLMDESCGVDVCSCLDWLAAYILNRGIQVWTEDQRTCMSKDQEKKSWGMKFIGRGD